MAEVTADDKIPVVATEDDCNCLEAFNHELRKQGKEIDVILYLDGVSETRPMIPLSYVEKRPRGASKHPYAVPTHCPWCGRKYRHARDT